MINSNDRSVALLSLVAVCQKKLSFNVWQKAGHQGYLKDLFRQIISGEWLLVLVDVNFHSKEILFLESLNLFLISRFLLCFPNALLQIWDSRRSSDGFFLENNLFEWTLHFCLLLWFESHNASCFLHLGLAWNLEFCILHYYQWVPNDISNCFANETKKIGIPLECTPGC